MQEKKRNRSKLQSYFGIFITGGGIGWLIGLSVSAVVSIVITSVTGVAAAIIAAMSGIEQKAAEKEESEGDNKSQAQRDVNPWPLTFLVVGLIMGSILGILARNNHLLGSDISTELKRWNMAGLNQAMSEKDIITKLFEAQVSRNIPSGDTKLQASISAAGTVLFSTNTKQCDSLYKAIIRSDLEQSDAELVKALARIEQLKNLPEIVSDSEVLRNIVEKVLCPSN